MAGRRHIQDDRARRFAVALATFCRAQSELPLQAVAESSECLSLIFEVLAIVDAERPAQRRRKPAGRHRVHDRAFAKAALLDFVTTDPDGMATQAVLIRELERRFEASGHPMPGETWLKVTVREFQAEAATFELDAANAFHASTALQAVFVDLADFLRFRRAKTRAGQIWRCDPSVRAEFDTPEKLLEAAFHKCFSTNPDTAIPAYSRLAHRNKSASSG